MKNSLPPIPIPAAQRWRDFRLQVLPAVTFLGTLLAVILVWRSHVAPATLTGELETVRQNIVSPKPGLLVQLQATTLQPVKAGQTIAHVITTDPKILAATLAVVQAEIGLLQHNLEPLLGHQRYQLSLDNIRLDWMRQRVDLATAKAGLQLAETESQRAEELYKDKIISERAYQEAKTRLDQLRTEVEERSKLVADQQENLERLRLNANSSDTNSGPPSAELTMRAAIGVQEQKLRLAEAELSPIPLQVPMDGLVSTIYRRSGETIMAGEPILTISALDSDRIIAFMRQPLSLDPQPGMKCQVRSRTLERQIAEAEVLHVGTQMEPISATLYSGFNPKLVETGLPILVSRPPQMRLRPGEIVDLVLKPN